MLSCFNLNKNPYYFRKHILYFVHTRTSTLISGYKGRLSFKFYFGELDFVESSPLQTVVSIKITNVALRNKLMPS